tara:strand:+ start:3708 stop:3872 length:165 start_codon:yes stop_codon:yes gene_type:complete
MYEISDALDKNWSKEKILEKLRQGQKGNEIVKQFIKDNRNNLNKIIELISACIR